jgi:hypothetical protein
MLAFILGALLGMFIVRTEVIKLKTVLYIISTIATVIIAMVAILGLYQWREQIKGEDKYKALKYIKIKLLDFKKKYQSFRLDYLHQVIKISKENYPILKSLYSDYIKQLWQSYDILAEAVSSYEVIHPKSADFLKKLIGNVHGLIFNYEVSADIYYEALAKNQELGEYLSQQCKEYLIKEFDESDRVSKQVNQLVDESFKQIDEEQDW